MEQQEASLESFLKWAAEHGVSDSPPSSSSSLSSSCYSCLGHSLSISHFPQAGGRGLAAVRDLRKGEMILRVPKSMLMTRDSVMEKDQTIAHALKLYPSLSSTQVLAVCLLAELNKRRRSVWYPYLMELPRSYDTLTTFGAFETKALQVDDAVWLTERVVSKAELEWREAIPLMEQLDLKPQFMNFKAWLWASATAIGWRMDVVVCSLAPKDIEKLVPLNPRIETIDCLPFYISEAEDSLDKYFALGHHSPSQKNYPKLALSTFRKTTLALVNKMQISSRTLHVPWDDAGCLCPVGDLFNYAAPGEEIAALENSKGCVNGSLLEVESFQNGDRIENPSLDAEECDSSSGRLTDGGYEDDVQAYCFYAKKNYRKDEQVLLSYGTYTNLELLEHYGFLLDRNPNEKVFMPFELDIFASHSWPADSLYIHQDGWPSFSVLSALRLWATSRNQRKSVGRLAFSGSQLSPENEKTVMNCIMSRCNAILESLPSTIEDDRSLLCTIDKAQQLEALEKPSNLPSVAAMEFDEFVESMGLGNGRQIGMVPLSTRVKRAMGRWRLAVQWRLSYKKTLFDCISFCLGTIDSVKTLQR